MVTQEKRMKFRQEVKELPLQDLFEMKSKLDVYSRDKQTILLEEIESRKGEQKQTHNKEVLEGTKDANKIASKSYHIAVYAIFISLVSLVLYYFLGK